MTFGSQGAVASSSVALCAPVIVAIIVVLGWLTQGCGRTSLLATDARDSSETRTSTSTLTSIGGANVSPAPSQPTTDGGCPTGFTACGKGAAARCYDLSRSVDHCGQCGSACAPGIVCQSSRCQQYLCKGALTFKALPAIPTAPSDPSSSGLSSYLPVLGDFDGDGTLDFVGQSEIGAPMGLLLGKGDGTFRAHAVASAFSRTWSAAAADLNGDGRLDLANINGDGMPYAWPYSPSINIEEDAAVTVRLGNGDPATLFEPATTYPTPSPPGGLILADLDDDGHVDMVAAETQHLTLWRGAADGRLAEPVDIPVGLATAESSFSSQYLLLAADWNQDGVLDLLFGMATLRMLLGRGDGTFDKEIACGLALQGSCPFAILADFDHDQKLDMVMNSFLGAQAFLGMSGCNFSTLVSIPYAPPYREVDSLGVADLNGDGNPDIVIAAAYSPPVPPGANHIDVSLGDGHGGFASPLSFPSSVWQPSGNFLMGDLNHDTKLDIIMTRPDGWQVLLNTCP